jgi:hypothetical protein
MGSGLASGMDIPQIACRIPVYGLEKRNIMVQFRGNAKDKT